jgi:hypothetical protein
MTQTSDGPRKANNAVLLYLNIRPMVQLRFCQGFLHDFS